MDITPMKEKIMGINPRLIMDLMITNYAIIIVTSVILSLGVKSYFITLLLYSSLIATILLLLFLKYRK